MGPTIAVVLVVRDGESFIARALASVAGQTRTADQVILVDHRSNDQTLDVARTFAAAHMPSLCISESSAANIALARNDANALATTDYIAVLDADDELLPEALALYDQAIEKDLRPDVIYGDCEFAFKRRRQLVHYPSYGTNEAFCEAILSGLSVPFKHSAIAYKTRAWRAIGGYSERFPATLDIYLVLRLLQSGARFSKTEGGPVCRHTKHGKLLRLKRLATLPAWYALINEFGSRSLKHKLLKTVGEAQKCILGR